MYVICNLKKFHYTQLLRYTRLFFLALDSTQHDYLGIHVYSEGESTNVTKTRNLKIFVSCQKFLRKYIYTLNSMAFSALILMGKLFNAAFKSSKAVLIFKLF